MVPKYDTRHNMTSIFSIIHAQNFWFLASSQLSVDGVCGGKLKVNLW